MKRTTLRTRGTGRTAMTAARLPVGREKAALAAGLSVPMIQWARRIMRFGTPELIKAVEDGVVALHVARRVCRWSPAAQREFLGTPPAFDQDATLTMACLTVRVVAQRA